MEHKKRIEYVWDIGSGVPLVTAHGCGTVSIHGGNCFSNKHPRLTEAFVLNLTVEGAIRLRDRLEQKVGIAPSSVKLSTGEGEAKPVTSQKRPRHKP